MWQQSHNQAYIWINFSKWSWDEAEAFPEALNSEMLADLPWPLGASNTMSTHLTKYSVHYKYHKVSFNVCMNDSPYCKGHEKESIPNILVGISYSEDLMAITGK